MPADQIQLTITDAIQNRSPRPATRPEPHSTSAGAVARVGELMPLRRSVQISPDLRRRLRVVAAGRSESASSVARRAIDQFLETAPTLVPPSGIEAAERTARLTISAPLWWWSRFRTAAVEADVPQHELVHASLIALLRR